MNKNKLTLSLILATITLGFFPQLLFATSLEFNTKAVERRVGEKVLVSLVLKQDGTPINALEGTLTFDPEFLTPQAVLDGDSIIATWIKSLDLKDVQATRGSLLFSGIIPRGLTAGGTVVTVVFTTKKEGQSHIGGAGIAYKHDGKATPVILSSIELPLNISEKVTPITVKEVVDATVPMITRIDIAQNEAIFDGKYFVVFSGKDTESGIDHFELLESPVALSTAKASEASGWKTVKSPAPLEDQTLKSFAYLKVVDRAGNSFIKEVPHTDLSPQNRNTWFSYLSLLGILIVTVFGVLFFFYHRKQGIVHDSY